jgi:hypothetical protein
VPAVAGSTVVDAVLKEKLYVSGLDAALIRQGEGYAGEGLDEE